MNATEQCYVTATTIHSERERDMVGSYTLYNLRIIRKRVIATYSGETLGFTN